MDYRFEAKQLTVLLIEPSSSTRAIIIEILRENGIAHITGIAEPKDALPILEVEPVDWIITGTYAGDTVNAFHLMKLITEHGILLPTRVSLLVRDEEKDLLPTAYSLGLLSHHPKVITKEVLTKEWSQLFTKLTEYRYNLALVAADYLRGYLNEICDHPAALALETELWRTFPEEFTLLENALPHMQELGETEQMMRTLHKLKLVYGESEQDKWAFLKAAYLPDREVENGENEEDDGLNYKLLSSALVVEPDETLHEMFSSVLTDFGAEHIEICTDGAKALAYLSEHPNPDVIIQEWRLREVTGPLFLQKALSNGGSESQFIVYSSLVTGDNVPLVKELGVAKVVEKPAERSTLLKALIQVIRQDSNPRELEALARKVRYALRKKDSVEARACLSQYQQSAQTNDMNCFALEAECELLDGNYEKAKELGMAAIKTGGHSIFVLNMMGKALSNLGDYKLALKCFEKAQEISPLNFRRLCEIAEVQASLGNEEGAKTAIADAKAIAGEGDPDIATSEVKVAVNAGDIAGAKKLMSQLDSLDTVVASLNNQAVALARCGRYDDSYSQYQKTIDSIPDDRPQIRAAVQYNLGLAYTRGERYEDAVTTLDGLKELKSKVGDKARSLTERLKKAIDSGTKIVLSTSSAPKVASETTAAGSPLPEQQATANPGEVEAHLIVKKGSLCCFQIFVPPEPHAKMQKWLGNAPRFAVRQSFSRAAKPNVEGEAADKDKPAKAS